MKERWKAPGDPRLIYEPGIYQFNGMQLQGLQTTIAKLEGDLNQCGLALDSSGN